MEDQPEYKVKNKILNKYKGKIKSKSQLVASSFNGVDMSVVNDVSVLYNLTSNTMADIMNISTKTLTRYTQSNKVLNAVSSEILLKLISLFNHGVQVFGNESSFSNWLQKPSIGLNNQNPFNYLKSSSGIDLVDEELTRIEYGDLA